MKPQRESTDARPEAGAAHNVKHPPDPCYHLPETGGAYAARMIDVRQSGERVCAAWSAFSADDGRERMVCMDEEGAMEAVLPSSPAGSSPVAAVGGFGHFVAWVGQDGRFMVLERRDGGAAPCPVHESSDWLREPFVCSDPKSPFLGAIDSGRRADALVLLRRGATGNWEVLPPLPMEDGRIFRPCGVVRDAAAWVAFEQSGHADAGRRIVVMRCAEGRWEEQAAIAEEGMDLLLPRLAVDARGGVWLTALADRVVERDGVVSHADSIRAWRFDATGGADGAAGFEWHPVLRDGDPDLVRLYRGLLPKTRYFGYSGLRRNPQPMALRGGRVFVCWEAQRSEDEDWFNLANGEFFALRLDAAESAPRVLADRGVCFQFDSAALHDPCGVRLFAKGAHRPDGRDFEITAVDMDAAPVRSFDESAGWEGWETLVSKPVRGCGFEPSDGSPLRAWFGDFHNHSIHSPDAEGFPDELYRFARDTAAVDFCGITDNDFYPNKALLPSESWYQRRLAKLLHRDGRFLPFTGFEWTFHRRDEAESYNHRSVVFHPGEERILRRIQEDGGTEDAFRRSAGPLKAFAHAHHGQFTLLDLEQEANVEVVSGWAVNIEKSPVVREHLDSGKIFGFTGGSDSHRFVPGLGGALTGVWAERLTYESVIEALSARRCFATMGNRTVIEFRVNGAWMGSVVEVAEHAEFFIRVRSEKPLKSVSLIGSAGVVHEFPADGTEVESRWTLESLPAASTWFYLRVEELESELESRAYREHPHNVCQASGPLAWSSPVWIVPW